MRVVGRLSCLSPLPDGRGDCRSVIIRPVPATPRTATSRATDPHAARPGHRWLAGRTDRVPAAVGSGSPYGTETMEMSMRIGPLVEPPPAPPRRARGAVSLISAPNGLLVGPCAPRIPASHDT